DVAPPPRTDLITGKLSKAEYAPYRTQTPVVVDGILDDEAWLHAPPDRNFYSRVSNPYGKPTTEPTEVFVSYDDRALYVAFRCGYSSPGSRDDALPENELRAAQYSEAVSVQVDPRNDGTNALSFQVTRQGFQVDVQMANNGEILNWDWHG